MLPRGTLLLFFTSTIYHVFQLFEATGVVDPSSPQPTGKKLDTVHAEVYIVSLILESPALHLCEVCHDLLEVFGIEVSPTICRLLRSYGFAQKIRQVASQRCASLRGAFVAQCHLLESVCLCGSMKPDLMLETGLEGRVCL